MSPTDPKGGPTTRAILLQGVSKRYRIYDKPVHRLYDLLTRGQRYREFWALRGVYLDIPVGSTVGIIGVNGAGKSTLLKVVSGITRPTTGEVEVHGRVTSLIELGAGFHPEFSGRENISLACSILGLSGDEIEAATQPIIDFSELGDFIDQPVKTYSSGMYVRLGFSVATCTRPNILLIDEALSVGDEHFRGKCTQRLSEFRESGGTTVFVSHDIGAVKSMCQHVVLLDEGEVLEQGPAERVADAYLKRVKERGEERLSMQARGSSEYPRWGSGEIEVTEIDLLGPDGTPGHVFHTGEHFTVRMHYRVNEAVREPVFGLGIYRSDGTYVNGSNHHWREQPIALEDVQPGEEGEVDMALGELPLLQGEYYLTAFLYDHGAAPPSAVDHREHAVTFQVIDPNNHQHGMLCMTSAWAVRRRVPGQEEPVVLESGK